MLLYEARRKANLILDEERASPTVGYELLKVASDTTMLLASLLVDDRGSHPRRVRENPNTVQLKSTNYDLLGALFDQVPEAEKPSLFHELLARILRPDSFRHKPGPVLGAGQSSRCASELPLVAEFLVRRGDKEAFFNALSKAALSPGLSLLLVQLEEMIALNFTVFKEQEYGQLPSAISGIAPRLEKFREQPRSSNTHQSNTVYYVGREIPVLCASVVEECRKAIYFYVKGSLLPQMNLEVNQDKGRVQTFLEKLGFSQLLIQSLEEAERLYRTDSTPFDLKSSMGHLRSFLEQLHLQASALAHKKHGGTLAAKWGDSLLDLRNRSVLTLKEEQFVAQFYALMSDAAVHPLVAEREYARLMRNMSIEYGLLLLTKLDKLGLR
jgi:hypothetical protein